MKRYALFVGSRYYPSGGWRDFVGSFDTIVEAREAAWPRRRHETMGWYHIADTEQGRIVEDGDLDEEEIV